MRAPGSSSSSPVAFLSARPPGHYLPLALWLWLQGVAAALAQNVDGDAIDSLDLSGQAGAAAQIVDIVPGGEDQTGDMGAGCSGYIYAASPDLELTIDRDFRPLGIFVDADVDTTLVINDPDGNWHCNDDADDLANSNPGLSFSKPKAGIYDIWVGTYNSGESGNGKLVVTQQNGSQWASIDTGLQRGANAAAGGNSVAAAGSVDFGDNLSNWSNDGECDDPRFSGDGAADTLIDADRYHDASDCRSLFEQGRVSLVDGAVDGSSDETAMLQRGSLDSSDDELDGFGYVDTYTFEGEAGATAVIDLQSADFDTYLVIEGPDGEQFNNDDYEGSYSRSLLSLELSDSGTYTVQVTSFDSDATGSYTLEMLDAVPAGGGEDQVQNGTLASGDSTYEDGEYVDTYTFEGSPGQTVTIALDSSAFDTYLVLETPAGETEANDDAGDSTTHSQLVTQLSDVGTYSVHVTSYGAAETGEYQLRISYGIAASSGNNYTNRDSVPIDFGDSQQGNLETSDLRSDDGHYQDYYAFTGEVGDTVQVDLRSGAFDTYLSVVTPSGQSIDNDDFDGSTDRSVVEFTLQEGGRYRVIASTYSGDAVGNYALALNRGSSGSVAPPVRNSSGGNIYGLFAGMADYPGDDHDLELTDQDALRARDALINGAGMDTDNAYTLIDSEATNANFRAALATIGSQADADDTVVIFYSGHGSFYDRADGPNNTDPDGRDESIELYDGPLLDDELAALLDEVHAGTILLVFDSCFSGGFAKDVVSAPGRMGLFSSEEDVTSQVAFKFQAGGYLAAFFDEAIRGNYADQDMNNEVTALELSQYLHDRYRADVKSFGSEYVQTSGPQSSYQHLVVDRGGVGAYDVLFHH